ncbi:MAG: SpoIIE family protein phosphatase [Candidatus Schekmanbacteria bacterium]|nr:SpoIIE family protein phosphatase [Candidatus Schekmanbacteria bacterium]
MNSKIVTPIQQLTESARRIGRGNFDVSISVSSEDEIGVLSSTLGNMAQSLKQSYSNLSLLNQIGEELSADLAREDFLNRALGRLARLINVEHGIILAGNGGSMRRMTRLACNGAKLSVPVDFALPTELLPPPNSYRLLDSVEALPEPFRCEACAGRIRSVLALPLPRENRVTGLIAVWTLDTERPLTEYEAELAMNVARQIAIGLETVEKVRMSGELEAARNIQRVLFPDGELNLDGFEAAGSLQTASETGGDWYTYRVLHDGRVLLLIGDVTGHGMPAAMIVSTVDSCFHTMATSFIDPSPGSALSVLNRVVYQTTKGRVKMTLFASLYSPLTGEMAFANAGHTHPLLVRSRQDRVEPLRARGPRLGHFEDAVFQESRMQLQKGDSLVYYTDGLVECENPAGEPFGKRRLQEAAASIAELPVLEANTLLLDQVNKFRQDKALADDIALLVARIRP